MSRQPWWSKAKHALYTYPVRGQKRELSDEEQTEFDAVSRALVKLAAQPDGQQVTQIARLIFFRKSHTAAGAGLVVGYSERQVKRKIGKIIFYVAKELGYLE